MTTDLWILATALALAAPVVTQDADVDVLSDLSELVVQRV
ncbi:hypothetical protein GCM10009814_07100 [Lapillicoccus jejuensis]|uniref:PIN domain-containing protein n=1 Tax=Lapillicoccus jejuensis TaxID=402171 RepID=A0A542DZT0_9MICO|nr:hypothetical protein FB458_1693 [Lapillicoccus jejuensis]